MAMQNVFNILVDLKVARSIDQPLVTQNDSVVFILEVVENGVPFDLTDTTTVSLAHTRRDGTVVVTTGTTEGNKATFVLGTNETAVAGGVVAKAQFYDADGRVSTLSFGYTVGTDPTGSGYVPSESEATLIEIVLNDGPLIIQSAEEAAAYATAQGDYVETKRSLIETFTGEQTNLQTQLNDLVLQSGTDIAEVVQARGGEVTLNARLDKTTLQLAEMDEQKASKEELQQVSTSYKESYDTLTLLQNAYPTGDAYNHSVLADGLIYTYTTSWVSTGIQANGTGIADGSLTTIKYGDKSVTRAKRTPNGEIVFAGTNGADIINFNFTDKQVIIPNNYVVIHRNGYISIATRTVDVSSFAAYILVIETANANALTPKLSANILETDLVLAYVDVTSKRVTMVGEYKINGVSPYQKSKWEGKTANFLGDSITFGIGTTNTTTDSYPSLLKSSLGFQTVRNYGISGSTVADHYNTTGDNPMVNRFSEMDNNADLVVVFGGTNDYSFNAFGAFGTMDDRVNSTFYGALHLTMSGLMSKYPNKTIAWFTPLHRQYRQNPVRSSATFADDGTGNWLITTSSSHSLSNNDPVRFDGTSMPTNIIKAKNYFVSDVTSNTYKIKDSSGNYILSGAGLGGGLISIPGDDSVPNPTTGKILKEYVLAIKEVAEYYGIPVFDLYAQSGMNPTIQEQRALLWADGIHPNTAGQSFMAKRISGFLNTLY